MTVVIVDYGMGNLGSVRRALQVSGASAVVSDDPGDLATADRIILPGVGAFAQAMQRLDDGGWTTAIRNAVEADGIPLLGICLGMQLLATESTEFGLTKGLGLIPGRVERIKPNDASERVPHVGWNEVIQTTPSPLFAEIRPRTDFYFVHSYRFVADRADTVLAHTPFAGTTVSAIGREHLAGVQFHPEKSSRAGLQLLRNFLEI